MSDLILEVTAGVGGQEAMLFTAEVWKCFHFYLTVVLTFSCLLNMVKSVLIDIDARVKENQSLAYL